MAPSASCMAQEHAPGLAQLASVDSHRARANSAQCLCAAHMQHRVKTMLLAKYVPAMRALIFYETQVQPAPVPEFKVRAWAGQQLLGHHAHVHAMCWPQVVVVGDQSSGKSSVVQRLAELSLPKDYCCMPPSLQKGQASDRPSQGVCSKARLPAAQAVHPSHSAAREPGGPPCVPACPPSLQQSFIVLKDCGHHDPVCWQW